MPRNYLLYSLCLSASIRNMKDIIKRDEKCAAQPCSVLWAGNESCKALTGFQFCLEADLPDYEKQLTCL
jgi:hypothetical protein